MPFLKNLTLDDIPALIAREYADIAARDAETSFQIAANLNRMVRIDSPVSLYMLMSVNPSVWVECSTTKVDTLSEILALGNTTGGSDIIVSAGDELQVEDTMTVGSVASPPPDVGLFLSDPTKALLVNSGTQAQRDAITPTRGMQYYNTDADDLEFYNGTAWQSMGGGDVVGPASSIDNAIARFDGTTGKVVQNSVVTLDDTGVLTGITEIVGDNNAQLAIRMNDLDISTFTARSEISIFPDAVQLFHDHSDGGIGGTITTQSIVLSHTLMQVKDGINSTGLKYDGNYKDNFTARSLIDKDYVDTSIAAVVDKNIFDANGSLTSNRIVDLVGFTLDFSGNAPHC